MNYDFLPEDLRNGIVALQAYGFLNQEKELVIRAVPGAGIVVDRSETELVITYDTEPHFYMALARGLIMDNGRHVIGRKTKNLGLMLDCSRNAVPKPEMVKKLICLLVMMGYDYLELYTEETYELPGEPYFGYKRGRYSAAELKEIVAFADTLKFQMVPCIQTLAHLKNLANWWVYFQHMDIDDILLAGDEKTYALIRKCIRHCKEVFHTKRINIGGDEAFRLGRGKYMDINGYRPKGDVYRQHMAKVFEICGEEGVCPEFWADGLVSGDVDTEKFRELLDGTQTPISWHYGHDEADNVKKDMEKFRAYGVKGSFAAGLWKWFGYAPDNQYAERSMNLLLPAAIEGGTEDILITAWGDNGNECSVYAVIPAMLRAAQLLYPCEVDAERLAELFTGYTASEWKLCDRLNYVMPDLDKMSNAAKYLLHNDFLIGILDYNIPDHAGDVYKKLLPEFTLLAQRENAFSYIFQSYEALCRILVRKATYGKRLYRAYQERNSAVMKDLVEELPVIKKDLQAFYDAFRRLWLKDYKGFGFEVMDVRIGGLLTRIDTVRIMLNDYMAGRTERIYELEEERIEYFCGRLTGDEVYAPIHGDWASAYTVNHI